MPGPNYRKNKHNQTPRQCTNHHAKYNKIDICHRHQYHDQQPHQCQPHCNEVHQHRVIFSCLLVDHSMNQYHDPISLVNLPINQWHHHHLQQQQHDQSTKATVLIHSAIWNSLLKSPRPSAAVLPVVVVCLVLFGAPPTETITQGFPTARGHLMPPGVSSRMSRQKNHRWS